MLLPYERILDQKLGSWVVVLQNMAGQFPFSVNFVMVLSVLLLFLSVASQRILMLSISYF